MKKVYFIGIGGIGMSALARYYKNEGYFVSGSDKKQSEVTNLLENIGIEIFYNDKVNVPNDVEKVIYTLAINEDDRELLFAKSLKDVKVLSYPEALGEMTKEKKVIAICGTHGKTTTTAMVFEMLNNAGINLSMILGSLIYYNGEKTNYIKNHTGNSSLIVIEACEYKRSFLNYFPETILITNIDNDHLDYYKDIEDIKLAFKQFINNLKPNGKLIIHNKESYLDFKEKYIAEDYINQSDINLQVPGKHNRENAQLVYTLGKILNLDDDKIKEGLYNFKGTWRRQEYKGKYYNTDFYDDYAHHPKEIEATLLAFKEKFPNKKILAIFEPHLYSRTKLLFDDFVKSLNLADKIYLLPIYAAREKKDESINSDMLALTINKSQNKAKVFFSLDEIKKDIMKEDLDEYIVLTLGAGSVNDLYKIL